MHIFIYFIRAGRCEAQYMVANNKKVLWKNNSIQARTNLGIFCLDGTTAGVDVLPVQTVLSLSRCVNAVIRATNGMSRNPTNKSQNTLHTAHTLPRIAYIGVFLYFYIYSFVHELQHISLSAKAKQH